MSSLQMIVKNEIQIYNIEQFHIRDIIKKGV